MHIVTRDHNVIDAEFRVISQVPRELSEQADFTIGTLLGLACMLSMGGGTYLGVPITGMTVSVLLASFAALLTTTHRHLAPIGFALALALGLSACSPAPTPAPAEAAKDKAAVNDSIREASRYRDPREGWKPKPMPVPGSGSQPSEPPKEAGHESR